MDKQTALSSSEIVQLATCATILNLYYGINHYASSLNWIHYGRLSGSEYIDNITMDYKNNLH